jgi:membrane associated rhomboid family serine protease
MNEPITLGIIAITCLISWKALQDRAASGSLSHIPYLEHRDGQYYRLLTSGFVHGSLPHLFINMYVLYQFGGLLEYVIKKEYGLMTGNLIYVGFYLVAIVFANLGTFASQKDNAHFASVGASGVTTATVFIYALFSPWQMFLFPPVPAIVFAVLYVGYSIWAAKQNRDNIDHQAHLWGAVFGIIFFLFAFPDRFSLTLHQLLNPSF